MAADEKAQRSDGSTGSAVSRRPDQRVGRGGAVPASWGLGDGQAIPWEYAPAPEARDIVDLKARYGLFVGGKEVAPRSGE